MFGKKRTENFDEKRREHQKLLETFSKTIEKFKKTIIGKKR